MSFTLNDTNLNYVYQLGEYIIKVGRNSYGIFLPLDSELLVQTLCVMVRVEQFSGTVFNTHYRVR